MKLNCACVFLPQQDKLNWNEKQIQLWAKAAKAKNHVFSDYEAIAVIFRANFLVTGHRLTETQIICCLIALQRGSMSGKLLQVATGEGKSTIICILAIIHALRGSRVDVITSSPVLAERDAKQKAKLYRMFSLTCSDNSDKTAYVKGAKDCYTADIVYGEMSQFQFDILRDNYSKLGTLGQRKFMTAIVDEVDSMLIDDSSKIARLSATVPGMSHFQAVYVFIWQHLTSMKERFITLNNRMYFVSGKVGFENGKIILEVAGDDGEIFKICDLESYIIGNGNAVGVCEAVDDVDEYVRKSLDEYLDIQIENEQLFIPAGFSEFLENQKPKWIENAMEALKYQENVHYVVQDGEIRPVDYFSTGIVQNATSWSDGLHQFLQLKHNVKMTCETLTTNFLSNLGFMKKYSLLYGLTGTLGSAKARDVLRDVYNVELINIPQRRQKQYLELEPVVANGQLRWLKAISENIVMEAKKDRGTLVICETIEHANRISSMLKKSLRPSAVKTYTMNNTDQEKNVEKIYPGEVIVATNLAGRGTDIQTEDIEETGGLHVILTFMPSNQRVEDQAFGRTARQGKRGTGLIILDAQSLTYFTTREDVKKGRDRLESVYLAEFQADDLPLIQVKDKLFDKFCSFLNDEIRKRIRTEENVGRRIWGSLTDLLPTTYERCMLAAVEEQWAGFLRKIDEGAIARNDAELECAKLIAELKSAFEREKLIRNPYYYISIGNDILVHEWNLSQTNKAKRALGFFRSAIQLEEAHSKRRRQKKQSTAKDSSSEVAGQISHSSEDADLVAGSGAAHLGVAWCLILMQEGGALKCKTDALSSLNNAKMSLANEMSLLNATQLLMQQRQPGFSKSNLCEQLQTQATILGSYIQGIDSCIVAIRNSKRRVDVVSIEKKKSKSGNTLRTFLHCMGLERNDEKRSDFTNTAVKLSSENNSITFNHLTTSEDLGTRDQALTTLQSAFCGQKDADNGKTRLTAAKELLTGNASGALPEDYRDISINLQDVDLSNIQQELFKSDKEYTQLTREMAITRLKTERSYLHAMAPTKASMKIFATDKPTTSHFNEKDINDLIKIVEHKELSDTSLRFDILLKGANKNTLNSTFDGKKSMEIDVTFANSVRDDAAAKVKATHAESVDVDLATSRSSLRNIIENEVELKTGVLCMRERLFFEKVERKELLKRVCGMDSDEDQCAVKLNNVDLARAESIINSCDTKNVFRIHFNNVHDFFNGILEQGTVDLSFKKLNRTAAEKIISLLREKGFQFSLQFHNLSEKQVKFVLRNAQMDQERMKISKVRSVSDLFLAHASPKLELDDFASRGLEFMIVMNEKFFVPWRSMCIVSALSAGQVMLGGALMITGFCSSLGMALVSEGFADAMVAYRAYSTRQFRWNDYCLQKSVSLAISAYTLKFSKLKDAAKGIKTVTAGAGKEALEQAATQVITNRKAVAATLMATGQNLKSLTCKFIGAQAAEAVAREALNAGVASLANLCFDSMKPGISESVQTHVRRSFDNPELKALVYKMFAVDVVTESNHLMTKVEQIVADTINPRHDFMQKTWNSVCLPLLKGILANSRQYGSTTSMLLRIMGTLNGLKEVSTLTRSLCMWLVK